MNDQPIQKNKKKIWRRILRSQYFYCLLVGLCVWLIPVIDFLGGYRGFHLHVLLIPAILFPMLLAVIFTLIVLIRAIWSIIRLRSISLSIMLILITVAFWFAPRLLKMERPYLLGFKYRVLRLSSPQELREIAAKARMLLTEQRSLPGPGKSFWKEEVHAKLWEKMPKHKILELAHSSVVISVSDNNDIELSWGGALVGHWGIRIAEGSVEPSKYDAAYIMIEEDIAVYMSPH